MKKIMLVDDEMDLIETYGNFLKQKFPDLEVTLANSGNEGLELYKTADPKFDLIVSDISMDNGDGLFLVKEVTQLSLDSQSFVFLTGLDDVEDEQLFEIGANEVWYKPLSKEQFREKIIGLLNKG